MAVKLAAQGMFGRMVSLRGREIVSVAIVDAIGRQRLVSPDDQIVAAARSVGTSFGD